MNIALRFEGGAGDCLCANRFVPAIYDKYPHAKIDAFIDSEGNTMQEDWLRTFYPHFYNNIITIPSKKYKPFFVDSQFGVAEQGVGALENIPDEYLDRMSKYDMVFDMWIDGMKWTKFPFDFLRYFYSFPKPSIPVLDIPLPDKFAFLHLVPNNFKGNENVNESWYTTAFVKKLSSQIPCIVTATELTYPLLKHLGDLPNVTIVNLTIKEVAYIISKASIFIGIDSGLKYLAHGLSVPRVIYGRWAFQPHQVQPSHKLRWLTNPEDYVPVNYDLNYVTNLALRIIDNPILSLVPQIVDFNQQAIVRDYKVNLEKSILQ